MSADNAQPQSSTGTMPGGPGVVEVGPEQPVALDDVSEQSPRVSTAHTDHVAARPKAAVGNLQIKPPQQRRNRKPDRGFGFFYSGQFRRRWQRYVPRSLGPHAQVRHRSAGTAWPHHAHRPASPLPQNDVEIYRISTHVP